tara:strand:+ start:1421 stop:1645 length:225 start_codon:yes stop_codon:yes gene_type:complete
MNSSEEIEIFVPLLEEGTEVWRPVKAESLNNDLFKIISINESDETWEFTTGQTVKCITKTFADGKSGLVAIERV